MFGESSNHQCSGPQSSHVPRKLKAQFNATSVSSAGSYSMVTSGKCQMVKFINMCIAAHSTFQIQANVTFGGSFLGLQKRFLILWN